MTKKSIVKPIISVVVSVYNVEQYLDRCVKSILNQTFSDFELILVDDGSKDKSGVMCDKWAKKDKRIIVIHKLNGGLSDARNCGVNESHGQFVVLIDSDDYVSPEFLSYLYSLIQQNDADISVGKFIRTSENEIHNVTEEDFTEVPTVQTCCIKATQDAQYEIICNKMYKKELLVLNPFPVGRVHEDSATIGKLLYSAKKIAVGSKTVYYYYQNPNSITHSPGKKQREDQIWAVAENALFFEQKEEKKIANYAWQKLGTILMQNIYSEDIDKNLYLQYCNLYLKHSFINITSMKIFCRSRFPGLYKILKDIKHKR